MIDPRGGEHFSLTERLELGSRLRRQDQRSAGVGRPLIGFLWAIWVEVWGLFTFLVVVMAGSGSYGLGWGEVLPVGMFGVAGGLLLFWLERHFSVGWVGADDLGPWER